MGAKLFLLFSNSGTSIMKGLTFRDALNAISLRAARVRQWQNETGHRTRMGGRALYASQWSNHMRRFSMRSWLIMSAVGLGWAASASAVEPVSFMTRRTDSILNRPADRLDVQLVSCTNDPSCQAPAAAAGTGCDAGAGTGCDGMAGDCVGGDAGCGTFGGCGLLGSDGSEPFDLGTALLGEDSGWDVGGWVSAGYTNKSDGVLNTRPDALNIHQAWLYAEKIADGSEGLDWGARVDALWGLDGENTQAYGNPNRNKWDFQNSFDHGSFHNAIPQAYGVLAYDKLSVKIGHFYTPAGYEVVPSNGNFFYSHAFTWNFTEPFTHTGALATYTASDDVTLYGGWVEGWDTAFSRNNGGSSFIGGATVKASDNVTVSYIGLYGNQGWIGHGTTHHLVVTSTLTDKLTYVLSSDIDNGNRGILGGTNTFHSVSAANYLLYNINDKLSAGVRAEWIKVNGVSYYEVTKGINIKPAPNLIIRPEVRYQWSPAGQKAGGFNPLGVPVDQTILGIDAIYTF